MKPETPSFQQFESRMEAVRTSHPHLWMIRDLVYRLLVHGGRMPVRRGLGFLSGLLRLTRSALADRGFSLSRACSVPAGSSHFIFVNSAPNHFGKIHPLYLRNREEGHALGWVEDPRVRPLLKAGDVPRMRSIGSLHVPSMRPADLIAAFAACRKLAGIFPGFSGTRFIPGVFFSLIRYYSMRRHWQRVFHNTPSAVFTTYEKSIAAKSMFEAALAAGCPRRVHILHGMFHPSLGPTFATEMWCATEREAESAREHLPPECKAICVISDEAVRLRKAVGMLDPATLNGIQIPRILVLGTSTDPTYTAVMRKRDLATLDSLMRSAPGSFEWRFRPHPGAVEAYRGELEDASITVSDFSLRALDDDLRWAHIIITPFSSVGVQAHDLGRMVFWNQPADENMFDIESLISSGIGSRLDPHAFHEFVRRRFPKTAFHEVPLDAMT